MMTHPHNQTAQADPAALDTLLAGAAKTFADHGSDIAHSLANTLPETTICLSGKRSGQPCNAPDLSQIKAASNLGLIDHVKACNAMLHWRRPGYGTLPAHISGRIKVVEIVGPDGMIPHDTLRFGVLWQGPRHFYPQHSHAAEELYHILSGHAEWGQDDLPSVPRSEGQFVHHPPWMRHSIRTSDSPLIAVWGWTGDIASTLYRLTSPT